MITDRELIERAARAADIHGFWVDAGLNTGSNAEPAVWNPLEDDGDALRLAVRLRLRIIHYDISVMVESRLGQYGECVEVASSGRLAATRRAIACTAAKMAPA